MKQHTRLLTPWIAFVLQLGCTAHEAPTTTSSPRVLLTEPADGAREVPIDRILRVVFDQRMRTDAGELVLSTGQVLPAARGAWSGNGQVLAVAPTGVLPSEANITVGVRGFQALGGEPAGTADFGFRTGRDAAGPYVVSTVPDVGAVDVPTTATVAITFSEPMDPQRGTISIERREVERTALRWSPDRRTALVATHALAPESTVRVTTGDDFVSADGRKVVRSFSTWFATRDDVAPMVLASTPRSGAEGDLYAFSIVQFFLSEAVVAGSGTAEIASDNNPLAASLAVADIIILPGGVLSVRLTGLREETDYRLSLVGFTDRAGNPLDTRALGPDGAFAFRVNGDVRAHAPVVVWAAPAEGSQGVDPSVRRVDLHFSQPIQPGLVFLDATDGVTGLSASPTLTIDSQDPRRAYFELDDGLRPGYNYRVALSSLQSSLGLGLATVPYLGDGYLDFSVGADTRRPALVRSTPAEGHQDWYPVDVDYLYVDFVGRNGTVHRKVLTLDFDEAMDTRSSTVTIECLGCLGLGPAATLAPLDPVVASGSWSTDGRTLVIELEDGTFTDPQTSDSAPLMPNATLRLDLRHLRDRNGNPLDPVPQLRDGYLDFTTAPLDRELNHTCTHYLGRSPVREITAAADPASHPLSLPLSGVPHDLNRVALPLALDGGQYRGWVRHDPATQCSTSFGRTTLYFGSPVTVRVSSAVGAWSREPAVETAAAACPEVITLFSRWDAPANGLLEPLVVELTSTQPTVEYVLEGLDPELGCN